MPLTKNNEKESTVKYRNAFYGELPISAILMQQDYLEEGENLKTVSELLGHTDISITGNTYAHVMPEIKRNAAVK